MTEETANLLEPPKAYVRYMRKRSPEQYGTAEASVSVPVDLPLTGPDEAFWKTVDQITQAAKISVLDVLEIEYSIDNGTLVESPVAQSPAQAAVSAVKGAIPGTVETGGAPNCPECGGPMYDNAQKKAQGQMKSNAPDFKCKNYMAPPRGTNCPGVIWPPR